MPLQKGFGLHNDQRLAPIEAFRQRQHYDPGRGSRAGPDLALGKQCQLLSQEQVLSNQRYAGQEKQSEKIEQTRF